MAGIVLENVTKRFGAVGAAVDNISLTIEDGEFFALLGPSGCGKTTTLRMIAGLERPSAGHIFIGEREVTELAPRERDVAMVFQDYALYPHMTILENIGYPLKVRGVPKAELHKRVRDAAGNLQIGGLLERRPGQLSGGQQQRAAVARAVVHHAQVFLFDEPLSNLDAKLRVEARGFLKHLQHELGVTTVYVTHDQAEAMALADRMAILDQGRVMQVGAPLEVYRHPRNTFVAAFIGNPPMNLLRCRLDLANAKLHIVGSTLSLDIGPLRDRLTQHVSDGDELILGVRPEHLSFTGEKSPYAIPGQVYVTQPLGSESLVILQVGEANLSVRIFDSNMPPIGERVWVQYNPSQAHLYRPDGGSVSG